MRVEFLLHVSGYSTRRRLMAAIFAAAARRPCPLEPRRVYLCRFANGAAARRRRSVGDGRVKCVPNVNVSSWCAPPSGRVAVRADNSPSPPRPSPPPRRPTLITRAALRKTLHVRTAMRYGYGNRPALGTLVMYFSYFAIDRKFAPYCNRLH